MTEVCALRKWEHGALSRGFFGVQFGQGLAEGGYVAHDGFNGEAQVFGQTVRRVQGQDFLGVETVFLGEINDALSGFLVHGESIRDNRVAGNGNEKALLRRAEQDP